MEQERTDCLAMAASGDAQAQDTTARSGYPEIIAIADRYMADYRHPDLGTLETLYDDRNNRVL